MSYREECFEVVGADGLVRRGIVTLPAKPSGIGLLLLPAGLKYHIGPGRLNVFVARRLAETGCTTLRIDPLGIGESDGRLRSTMTSQLWNDIALGAWIEDTVMAAHALRTRLPIAKLVVGGLCGGAITGQLTASQHPELFQGVLSLGTAVTLPESADGPRNEIVPYVARHHVHSYFRKLRSLEAWKRVLRAESDFRGIYAVLRAQVRHMLASRSRGIEECFPNENPRFYPSFTHLQAIRMPHLLLFGGSDNRWLEFQAAILKPRLAGSTLGRGYEVRLIENANHEIFLDTWKDLTVQHVQQWMQTHFGATREVAMAATPEPGIQVEY